MNNNTLCDKWLKNPLVNPETNRKIVKDGPKYKHFKKICTKNDKNDKKDIKSLCEKWFENPLINPETNKKIVKDGPKYKQLKKLCDKIVKTDNDRIIKFKEINNVLSTINKKNGDNNCMKCSTVNDCYIADFIKIGDLISKDTLSGVIYKSIINDIPICIKIVNDYESKSKSSNNNVFSEIRTLEFLTKYVIKTNFPHFPIGYDVLKCDRKIIDKYDNIPEEILSLYKKNKNANLLMIMSELADGSLYYFYKNILKENYTDENNKKILLNAFGQIFISIIFFHKIINAFHNDSHEGNFLFRKIKAGGYYHYNIFGKDYYIENLGYLWEIWDFGLIEVFRNSEEVNKNRIDIIKEPLFSFKNKTPKNLLNYFSVNASSRNTIYEYNYAIYDRQHMIKMFPKNDNSKYLYDFFNEFSTHEFISKNISLDPLDIPKVDNNVLKLMLKHNLIKDKINVNDIIINKTPYTI